MAKDAQPSNPAEKAYRKRKLPDWLSKSFRLSHAPLYLWMLLLLAMLTVPGLITAHSPTAIDPLHRLQAPSTAFPLGTDEYGRSLWSRIVFGGRLTLVVAFSSIGLAAGVGVPLGTLAGYYAGWIDTLAMRTQDALLSLPGVLLAILLVGTFGASTWILIVSIAVVFAPRFARLQRGSVLLIKNRPYIEASRAAGASSLRIIVRDILPNTLGPLIVQVSLGLAVAVLIEAGLSYLGLGVQPPNATWGLMLKDSQPFVRVNPYYVLFPGFFLFCTILTFNLLGDALRERLDPRQR